MGRYDYNEKCMRCGHTWGCHSEGDEGPCRIDLQEKEKCDCSNFVREPEKKWSQFNEKKVEETEVKWGVIA